jgi:hypothetical protein
MKRKRLWEAGAGAAALLVLACIVGGSLCWMAVRWQLSRDLGTAIKALDTQRVRELVRRGVDVNHQDGQGSTPLMAAAWHGHPEVVKLLLRHGARTDLKDREGETALSLARKQRRWDVLRLLQSASR